MNANDIVNFPPAGYREATTIEAARQDHPAYWNRMVWVRTTPGAVVLYIKDSK